MKIVFLFIVLGIYGLSNYYILSKILSWMIMLPLDINKNIIRGIYGIFMIIPFLTIILSNINLGKLVGTIGNYAMWIYFILFMTFITLDFLKVILRLTKLVKFPLSETKYTYTGILVLIFIVLITVYGRYNTLNIKEKTYNVNIEKKTSIKNLKIAMVSDLHLGYINGEKHLGKVVNIINKSNPDIVIIAGDIFDGNYFGTKSKNEKAKIFSKIKSKYGTYASLGNHDAGGSFEEMLSVLKLGNVNVLNEEYVNLKGDFAVIGRKDSQPIGNQGDKRLGVKKLESKIEGNLPVIVIDHRPSNFDEYSDKVDLVLSGHTHKGQIFPFNIATKLYHNIDYGHYNPKNENTQMIVSSGAGSWGPPVRIGTQSEVVEINVVFK